MISVVMASHNGARTLPVVLDAYRRAAAPPDGWRLIVVDNASSDETPSIATRYAAELPLLLLHEPRRGKNVALNRARPHFEGELVVLTDDDAVPEPDFLVKWAAMRDRAPEFDIFGGAIRPRWPEPPPDWILRGVNLGVSYAVTPLDRAEGPIVPTAVWGPNMAVRRRVFDSGIQFDEQIGPKGESYPMGSETSFVLRACREGARAWFCPDIVVHHMIRRNQLEEAWLLRRAHNSGRGLFWHDLLDGGDPSVHKWFGVPRWAIRKRTTDLLRGYAGLARAAIARDQTSRFRARWDVAVGRGWLHELRHSARGTARG